MKAMRLSWIINEVHEVVMDDNEGHEVVLDDKCRDDK